MIPGLYLIFAKKVTWYAKRLCRIRDQIVADHPETARPMRRVELIMLSVDNLS